MYTDAAGSKAAYFPEVLHSMEGEGVGVADVQFVQTQLMKKKTYLDLTGNFLNHPNDYLARIQAQTVTCALGECSGDSLRCE